VESRFEITVDNPGSTITSPGVPFVVLNPVPEIISLSPQSVQQNGTWFTLVVTGVNFVDGATVLWNGQPCVTTYESSSRLTARIEPDALAEARMVSVVVYNPEPGGRISNTVLFTVEPSAQVFLPFALQSWSP